MSLQTVSLLQQCARVVAQSPWVELDEDAVAAVAARIDPATLHVPAWSGHGMYEGPDDKVVGWLLAYNAINFCYWPDRGEARWYTHVHGQDVGRDDEAIGVMAALAEALRDGLPLHEGEFLAHLDPATFDNLLAPAHGAGRLPLMEERLEGLRELGRAYRQAGGPLGLLRDAGRSAPGAAAFLSHVCPSWTDVRIWRGEQVPFRKRAQLCVAMIRGRFDGEGPGAFTDLHGLTVFADYRLPQVLRGLGILRLDAGLTHRIAHWELLRAGSEEEVSLRAAAVHGGELLRRAWAARRPGLDALAVDYWLWRGAVDDQAALPPFHRTRTVDY